MKTVDEVLALLKAKPHVTIVEEREGVIEKFALEIYVKDNGYFNYKFEIGDCVRENGSEQLNDYNLKSILNCFYRYHVDGAVETLRKTIADLVMLKVERTKILDWEDQGRIDNADSDLGKNAQEFLAKLDFIKRIGFVETAAFIEENIY